MNVKLSKLQIEAIAVVDELCSEGIRRRTERSVDSRHDRNSIREITYTDGGNLIAPASVSEKNHLMLFIDINWW